MRVRAGTAKVLASSANFVVAFCQEKNSIFFLGKRGLLLLVEGEHPDVGFVEPAVEVNGAII